MMSVSGNALGFYHDFGTQLAQFLEKISTTLLLPTILALLYVVVDMIMETIKQQVSLKSWL
jgi:hypothetical protein